MSARSRPGATSGASDPLLELDQGRRATFSAIAGHLIPEAHGMPSAADADPPQLRSDGWKIQRRCCSSSVAQPAIASVSSGARR